MRICVGIDNMRKFYLSIAYNSYIIRPSYSVVVIHEVDPWTEASLIIDDVAQVIFNQLFDYAVGHGVTFEACKVGRGYVVIMYAIDNNNIGVYVRLFEEFIEVCCNDINMKRKFAYANFEEVLGVLDFCFGYFSGGVFCKDGGIGR